ncbi:hypothetical protein KEM56_007721 [Ascosphaera pollenicola]|nr:hypothetical protein KEM56_007721 [Ascosphaera pollenicola]
MAVKKRSAAAAAAGAASPEGSLRSQKRRRIDAYIPETDETAENTTNLGLQVIEAIRQTKDKHGRLIAGEFERLPDPDSAPGYYRAILLPISLQMVEQRLQNHEYRQLTHVECDLRRLVSNAKHYNENGSALFSNAERIRKVLAAEFPKINPAYNDPNYVPFSTPVPEDKKIAAASLPSEPVAPINEARGEEQPETPYLRGRKRTTKSQPQVPDKPPDINAEQQEGFEGLSFEAAQAKIISEMIKLKDETGLEVFYNFISKPDKNVYKEYYDIIKHPTSLRAILKLVRGTDNRKNSMKRSPFRTWHALEEEVSYIWRNASEFNEPGSAIVEEAEELKKYFLERLAEVRKVVPDPPRSPEASNSPATLPAPGPSGTRLKLKMGGSGQTETPQRITLRLNGKSQTESAAKDGNGQAAAKQDNQQETSETPRTRSLRERPPRAASQKSAASVKDFSPQPKPAAVKHESVTPSLANGAASQQSTHVATPTQPHYTTEPAVGTATSNIAAIPLEPQYHVQSTESGNVNFASNANPPPPAAHPTVTPADIALDQFRGPQHASAKNNRSRKGMIFTILILYYLPSKYSHIQIFTYIIEK